jgi:uncharacterized tellurite resistance protein B-like protein
LFQIEEIAALRPEEKDAILDAILGMAYADNKAQEEEVRLIKRYAAHFTDGDVDELLKGYKPDKERVGRKIAHSDLGPAGRTILVRSMALVAAASGDLDDKELAFYTQCLRAFGIPEARQKQIEQSVARSVYGELCMTTLTKQGGALDGGREQLDAARKKLGIQDDEAKRIEKHAAIEHRLGHGHP